MTDDREHIAWLLWCLSEGYTKAEDRAGMTNWVASDNPWLTPEDQALKADLLAMADEVLAAMPPRADLAPELGDQRPDGEVLDGQPDRQQDRAVHQ